MDRLSVLAILLFLQLFCSLPNGRARADEVSDFYSKSNLNLIIAFAPGGGYDLYARLGARHLGKFLPGNPIVIPQTMALAGGLKAANYLYGVARQDGSVIGLLAHNVMEQQVLGAEGIQYEANKFNWLGRLNVINEAEVVWLNSGVSSVADAFLTEIVLGASGPTASPTVYPRVLNNIVGTRFKIITGYSGAPEACLAMERGEVQGCLIDIGNIKTTKRYWIDEKKIGLLFQMGSVHDPLFPNTPSFESFGKTIVERQALAVFSVSANVGRALMAPPGISPARVTALRRAFDAMTTDREFLSDALMNNLEISAMSGVDLQKLVESAADIPSSVISRARAARESP